MVVGPKYILGNKHMSDLVMETVEMSTFIGKNIITTSEWDTEHLYSMHLYGLIIPGKNTIILDVIFYIIPSSLEFIIHQQMQKPTNNGLSTTRSNILL